MRTLLISSITYNLLLLVATLSAQYTPPKGGSNGSVIAGISNATYYPAACGSLITAPSWCSGSDMGAWINSAYADGTSPVNISIDPGTYNVTTAVSFATNGKIVTIQGNNAILNSTSTLGTSGTLISSTIGGGANPTIAIYNLQLKDSVSGSTATAVAIGSGGTNSDRARLINVFMTGFKVFVNDTSYDLEITNSIFDNCSSASGSIGITTSGNGDDTKITAGEVLGCATGVNNGNGNAVTLDNTVLGNATTVAVANNSGGVFTCNGCHYVNPAGTAAKFISNSGLYNDNVPHYEDDATTGTSGVPIANTGFFASNGGFVFSAGATYANFLTTSGASWNSSYNAFVQDRGGHLSDAYSRTTRGDRQISLENPDFESSNIIPPPGWITIGTSVVVSYETSTQAPNKTQSIKFTAGGQFAGLESLTAYSVIPGDTYSLQCAAKSDATSTPTCVVQFQTNTGSFVGNMQVGTSSTSWVNLSTTGTVPATAVKAVIFLSNNTAAGAGTSWFDQVSIQKTNFSSLTGTGPVITSSAKPTITGCGTISSQTGAGLSGTFVTNATSCTVVLTALPATTAGYACLLWDQTHALTSSVVGNASSTTTSATFGAVTTIASDRLSFNCGLSN